MQGAQPLRGTRAPGDTGSSSGPGAEQQTREEAAQQQQGHRSVGQ
jgi:hypothetical protein